jgi:predicted DNA-binding transcriptional regulator YafY
MKKQKTESRKRKFRRGAKAAARGAVKRGRYARMKKILGMLQEEKYPNCTTIASELEVSVKTAARDVDCMRDDVGYPIAYDEKRHGFYLTRPVEGFAVPVTARELFAVCVEHKALEYYRGTPFEKPLESAFRKMANQLDDEERFTLESMEEVLSIRPFAPEDADLKVFELVTQAMTGRLAIRFQYRKPGEKRAEVRHVHPYHLFEFGHRWYVLAHDVRRGAVRTFVVNRMRDTALTDERFTVPKGFDRRKHFEKSLGVMSGKGDYEVVVEMDAWLTDILRGRRLHHSQRVEELPDGSSRLRMRLSGLEEIEQYVLSWGTHAKVVGPPELRERVVRVAGGILKRYAEGA